MRKNRLSGKQLKFKKVKKKPVSAKHDRDADNSSEDLSDHEDLPLDSVVKIYTNSTAPNYSSPWQMEESEDCTGSGFIIDGRRILTNAHVVEHATLVMIRAHGQAERFEARVSSISFDCDLAVLRLSDESFWEQVELSLEPVMLSDDIPQLNDEVVVAGYPMGGDSLSLTKGIISRIEDAPYGEHSTCSLLNLQIDAAVNSGNSGGPVFHGDHCVGVAFSGLDEGDNIAYVIPCNIILHLLRDIERSPEGRFRGFCSLGISYQHMENRSLRAARNLKDTVGVLITKVDISGPCNGLVRRGDILLAINGKKIANDGTIKWRKRERLTLSSIVTDSFPGDTLSLSVSRAGSRIALEAASTYVRPLIGDYPRRHPRYVCWAGLVLVVLSVAWMDHWTQDDWDDAPMSTLAVVMDEMHSRKSVDQQIVVLSRVLQSECNISYEEYEGKIVKKVNGVEVLNLAHLWKLIQDTEAKDYVELEMEGGGELVVIQKDIGDKATQSLLKTHRIPTLTNLDTVQ